jgi:hypothetical protein
MSEKKPDSPLDAPLATPNAREVFRRDLEFLFQQALSQSQYQAALKAKELLAKEAGLLPGEGKKPKGERFLESSMVKLQDLSDDVLEALIRALSHTQKEP